MVDCVNNTKSPGFESQFQCKIKEVPTEFVIHKFANKWMVLIMQTGHPANFYTVQFDKKEDRDARIKKLESNSNNPDFYTPTEITAKCILGTDKVEVRAGIHFLVNRTKLAVCPTEILISLSMKNIDRDALNAIAEILNKVLNDV